MYTNDCSASDGNYYGAREGENRKTRKYTTNTIFHLNCSLPALKSQQQLSATDSLHIVCLVEEQTKISFLKRKTTEQTFSRQVINQINFSSR